MLIIFYTWDLLHSIPITLNDYLITMIRNTMISFTFFSRLNEFKHIDILMYGTLFTLFVQYLLSTFL